MREDNSNLYQIFVIMDFGVVSRYWHRSGLSTIDDTNPLNSCILICCQYAYFTDISIPHVTIVISPYYSLKNKGIA